MSGKVFLVGAGPGDPGLLTRRAAELIATADLVAIDALVSREIAAMVPPTTQVVHVGKRASAHTLPQDKINALLVEEAKRRRRSSRRDCRSRSYPAFRRPSRVPRTPASR